MHWKSVSRSSLQSAGASAPPGAALRATARRVGRRFGRGSGLFVGASIAVATQAQALTPAMPGAASSAAPVLLNCAQPGPRKPVVVGTKQVQVQVSCDPPPVTPPAAPPSAASAASQPPAGAAPVPSAPQASLPAAAPASGAASAPPLATPTGRDIIQVLVGTIALLLTLGGLRCLLEALEIWPFGPPAPAGRLTDASVSPDRPRRSDGFHFRRHWGGFGSESSGWDVSAPLMRLLVGLLLLALGLWLWMLLLADSLSPGSAGGVAAKPSGTAPAASTATPAGSASAAKG